MIEANLYIEQTKKGPGRYDGAYGYVLEFFVKGEPKTREEYVSSKNVTAHQMELIAITEALKRLTKSCKITIYSGHGFYKNALSRNLIKKWQEDNWKNAKGGEVANKSEWEELIREMAKHEVIPGESGHHAYSDYMITQMKKMEGIRNGTI